MSDDSVQEEATSNILHGIDETLNSTMAPKDYTSNTATTSKVEVVLSSAKPAGYPDAHTDDLKRNHSACDINKLSHNALTCRTCMEAHERQTTRLSSTPSIPTQITAVISDLSGPVTQPNEGISLASKTTGATSTSPEVGMSGVPVYPLRLIHSLITAHGGEVPPISSNSTHDGEATTATMKGNEASPAVRNVPRPQARIESVQDALGMLNRDEQAELTTSNCEEMAAIAHNLHITVTTKTPFNPVDPSVISEDEDATDTPDHSDTETLGDQENGLPKRQAIESSHKAQGLVAACDPTKGISAEPFSRPLGHGTSSICSPQHRCGHCSLCQRPPGFLQTNTHTTAFGDRGRLTETLEPPVPLESTSSEHENDGKVAVSIFNNKRRVPPPPLLSSQKKRQANLAKMNSNDDIQLQFNPRPYYARSQSAQSEEAPRRYDQFQFPFSGSASSPRRHLTVPKEVQGLRLKDGIQPSLPQLPRLSQNPLQLERPRSSPSQHLSQEQRRTQASTSQVSIPSRTVGQAQQLRQEQSLPQSSGSPGPIRLDLIKLPKPALDQPQYPTGPQVQYPGVAPYKLRKHWPGLAAKLHDDHRLNFYSDNVDIFADKPIPRQGDIGIPCDFPTKWKPAITLQARLAEAARRHEVELLPSIPEVEANFASLEENRRLKQPGYDAMLASQKRKQEQWDKFPENRKQVARASIAHENNHRTSVVSEKIFQGRIRIELDNKRKPHPEEWPKPLKRSDEDVFMGLGVSYEKTGQLMLDKAENHPRIVTWPGLECSSIVPRVGEIQEFEQSPYTADGQPVTYRAPTDLYPDKWNPQIFANTFLLYPKGGWPYATAQNAGRAAAQDQNVRQDSRRDQAPAAPNPAVGTTRSGNLSQNPHRGARLLARGRTNIRVPSLRGIGDRGAGQRGGSQYP